MLSFLFYNKNSNQLILDKNLRDYVKKCNMDSFNKFAEKHKHPQEYKNIKTNSSISSLSSSLMNYRNYSDTFTNNQTYDCDLENEDYLCNFCDLNDHDGSEFNNKNSNPDTENTVNAAKKIFFLIGAAGAFITIGTGITFLYYKKN
jgi:hypothetical protein